MKKFALVLFSALLVFAFTAPAMAIEHEFGGYWRTRAWTNQNFSGEDDTESRDVSLVDTRTRIYYTAILNDNLKFVNKFEIDAAWGDSKLGDIGADGVSVEVKNSYADFNIGSVNAKIGIQGQVLSRGFLFDDDFSGAVVTFKGEGFSVPVLWMKAYEADGDDGYWEDDYSNDDDYDFDYYMINPSFNLGETMVLNPFVMWATSDDASHYGKWVYSNAYETDLYYIGLNADVSFDMGSFWFTGIYETGEMDIGDDEDSYDVSAYLVAAGGSLNVGAGDIHGQVFYASGDDDDNDDDYEAFVAPKGQSYYWAEIMGYGTFDWTTSNGACADLIGNMMAFNIGASYAVMDKLTLGADLWYAQLAEEDSTGEDELGTEIDLSANYELVEGLDLRVVAAYLFADDRTTADPTTTGLQYDDDADPWELGAQLSLKF